MIQIDEVHEWEPTRLAHELAEMWRDQASQIVEEMFNNPKTGTAVRHEAAAMLNQCAQQLDDVLNGTHYALSGVAQYRAERDYRHGESIVVGPSSD